VAESEVRATLLVTCVVDVVAPEVGEAAVRLLRAAGCEVSCDLAQTCCGRPAWDAGFPAEAAAVARPTLEALEAELEAGAEVVVVPAGSCAAMVRQSWPAMFEAAGERLAAERARLVGGHTRELSELLAERNGSLPSLQLVRSTRVALHQSCHLRGEHRVDRQPSDLLDRIGGCQTVEWPSAIACCGFADGLGAEGPERVERAARAARADGTDRAEPVIGTEIDLLADLDAIEPDLVVGCDTACLVHLRGRAEAAGRPIEVRHLAEVAAEALPAGAGWR